MAWPSGAVSRLRAFPSPDSLLRMLLLHMARGYSLRETVVRANLANWPDISDVALLKRLRNSEEWLRLLCVELLRENFACHHRRRNCPRSAPAGSNPGRKNPLHRLRISHACTNA
jgi:hypothetical protein